MKEVVGDLQWLRASHEHPWVNNEESERLLGETSEVCIEKHLKTTDSNFSSELEIEG